MKSRGHIPKLINSSSCCDLLLYGITYISIFPFCYQINFPICYWRVHKFFRLFPPKWNSRGMEIKPGRLQYWQHQQGTTWFKQWWYKQKPMHTRTGSANWKGKTLCVYHITFSFEGWTLLEIFLVIWFPPICPPKSAFFLEKEQIFFSAWMGVISLTPITDALYFKIFMDNYDEHITSNFAMQK